MLMATYEVKAPRVAEILGVQTTTVQAWMSKSPNRTITADRLKKLEDTLSHVETQ